MIKVFCFVWLGVFLLGGCRVKERLTVEAGRQLVAECRDSVKAEREVRGYEREVREVEVVRREEKEEEEVTEFVFRVYDTAGRVDSLTGRVAVKAEGSGRKVVKRRVQQEAGGDVQEVREEERQVQEGLQQGSEEKVAGDEVVRLEEERKRSGGNGWLFWMLAGVVLAGGVVYVLKYGIGRRF